jgi:hypothetical protein
MLLLPLGLLGMAMVAIGHDQNQVQMIPESLMRETTGRVMTWRSDTEEGFFEVDHERLVAIVERLAVQAHQQVESQTHKLRNCSARACFWVYDVDPLSGDLAVAARLFECSAVGPRGDQLDLRSALHQRLEARVAGLIRSSDGDTDEYMPCAVLVGVSVGGEFEGLGEYLQSKSVQHAAVWVPREDIVL